MDNQSTLISVQKRNRNKIRSENSDFVSLLFYNIVVFVGTELLSNFLLPLSKKILDHKNNFDDP